jgi:hypothetical protein
MVAGVRAIEQEQVAVRTQVIGCPRVAAYLNEPPDLP